MYVTKQLEIYFLTLTSPFRADNQAFGKVCTGVCAVNPVPQTDNGITIRIIGNCWDSWDLTFLSFQRFFRV